MKCYHCGRGISDIWDAFLELLKEKTPDAKNPNNRFFNPEGNTLKEIFEQLGVEKVCCRSILTSSANFHDLEF